MTSQPNEFDQRAQRAIRDGLAAVSATTVCTAIAVLAGFALVLLWILRTPDPISLAIVFGSALVARCVLALRRRELS